MPPRASRGAPAVTVFQPARTGLSGAGLSGAGAVRFGPHWSRRRAVSRPPGRQGAAAAPDSPGAKGSWLVRTRLSLLAAASALAAAVATAGALHAIDIVQGPSYHSNIGSIRDGATASAILACIVMVVALAVGGWPRSS